MSSENSVYNFIIVGAGPAAVSAAWPLVKAGKQVLMIDAGTDNFSTEKNNKLPLNILRNGNHSDFFQGLEASKVVGNEFSSPKLKASGENFSKYLEVNLLEPINFTLTGLIGSGGLSRIWGGACACFDDDDLSKSSIKLKDLLPSYVEIADRIGMSGNNFSPISKFIGDKLPLNGSLEKTPLMMKLLSSYGTGNEFDDFIIGETLTAVTSKSLGIRERCTGCMRCMWGCPHDSIYSSRQELKDLKNFKNFHLVNNLIVNDLVKHHKLGWIVSGFSESSQNKMSFLAQKVLLGMGTFATTRLVMDKFLPKHTILKVLHNPAFSAALTIPSFLGHKLPKNGYGGSQLCFKIPLSGADNDYAYGLVYDAACLPAFDLMKHMPFTRFGALNITRKLLPSLLILMVYLPPRLTDSYIKLGEGNKLIINGGLNSTFDAAYQECVSKVKSSFRRLGAYCLPGSFKCYQNGAEVHYGCTLTHSGVVLKNGEIAIAEGVFAIDGSALPTLTAKSHTLSIMANADRIARGLI